MFRNFWLNNLVWATIFLMKKYTVGAAGTVAAPTNRFVGAAIVTAAPIIPICRGG